MTSDEIKLRQLAGQHLLARTDTLTATESLCGIQAQFMSNVLHSLRLRCGSTDTVGLVKNWTVRGTIHVFAAADLPLFLSCGEHCREDRWDIPSFWNRRSDWTLTPRRQEYLSRVILDALAEAPRSREELKAVCRAAGMTEAEESSMFHPWGGGIRELCERGFIHYAAAEEKIFFLSPAFVPISREKAKLELARRYFTHLAPATVHDAQYFFHTTAAQVKKWLAGLPVQSVQCGGNTYFYIETGMPYVRDIPRCLFLAGFDQLLLGYEKRESLYLAPGHVRNIFNLGGIVMPALLLDGRVTGRWKQKDGRLKLELFSPVSPGDRLVIEEQAHSLWPDLRAICFDT